MSISDDILAQYEMTIGIECHVQLATATKLFSPADNDARDAAPNSKVHPIDFGLPGMLPVLNRRAVELAVIAGKALKASIAPVSRFDRKHYFYPDLPNGYQITQMYQPTILAGSVTAPLENGETCTVRIHHAHLEADAGKLTHHEGYSLVDLNRAGTPLIEIVSEPDMHSPQEAKAYATELHRLMVFAGVTHGDLYHGNMRFDVNLSVAKKGSDTLGIRSEIKNLNSFRSVERAAEYEFRRQVELLERGERIVQETRGWREDEGITTSQRSKEEAQDYRYMPDADIPPIVLTDEQVAAIQSTMPMLPDEYRQRLAAVDIDARTIEDVIQQPTIAQTVVEVLETSSPEHAKRAAFWLLSKATPSDNENGGLESVATYPTADRLVKLSEMVAANKLSSSGAKDVFAQMSSQPGRGAEEIATALNLLQVSDESAIAAIVDEVLADTASAASIADIKAGKDKAIGFLVGQVMKKSQGKANPNLAQKLIREKL